MSFGGGSPINMSLKQKLNTRSSTEAEVVGVNDGLTIALWVRLFPEAQGIEVEDNIIFQDNMSSILLEKNGKRSSGRNTKHMEIRYFFVTDNVSRKRVRVEHCPTKLMWADFFTKPSQGSQFRLLRALIMNLPMTPELAHLMRQLNPKAIRAANYPQSVPLQECVEAGDPVPQDPSQPAEESREPIKDRTCADVAALPRQPRGTGVRQSKLTSLAKSS